MPQPYAPECAEFDYWLQARLREEYSAVLREAMPEALLRLVAGDGLHQPSALERRAA